MSQTGYFLFSLDTELAWGFYDTYPARGSFLDGYHERLIIKKLLNIFDKHGISATWALVGHMFFAECEKCNDCAIQSWKGIYPSYDHIYDGRDALWYGDDIVDVLRETAPVHEIAFHGHTHRVFNEHVLNDKDVLFEIDEWLRLSERKKIMPVTVIFPRNSIGFLPIFKKKGFICYRGKDLAPNSFTFPYIGKVLRSADRKLKVFPPIVYDIEPQSDGLINLPGSRRLFGMNPSVSSFMDKVGMGRAKVQGLVKGVKKAAKEKKVIHIRTHPFEFRADQDFDDLEELLSCVSDEIKEGRMQSVTMKDLAHLVLQRNHPHQAV